MLQRLYISNYTIIEQLEVDFSRGMNIITGETGAGKSILLGALALVLGERADTKVLLDKDKKCVVEATFKSTNHLKSILEQDFDVDESIVLRREIAANGKSRSFINDTPATLHQMKEIGEMLVNMHTQHETYDLVERGFQLSVLDTFAGIKDVLADYRNLYKEHRKNLRKLEELQALAQRSQAESDFTRFQLNELQDANLEEDEQETLEGEFKTLSNLDIIKLAATKTVFLMDESESSILKTFAEIKAATRPVENTNDEIKALIERLQSVEIEIKDLARAFERLNDQYEANPQRLEDISQRLNLIYRLQKKHGVDSIAALLSLQAKFEDVLTETDSYEQQIAVLSKQTDSEFQKLSKLASVLHEKRLSVSTTAAKQVTSQLQTVGMPAANFEISIQHSVDNQLNEYGFSKVEFLFSANKGFSPKPLKDVASGGELSRLMLCIKSLLTSTDLNSTLIFDEIDTGISGEVALKVGDIMNAMAKSHQIICITHLPQIARCGDTHLFVYKDNLGQKTVTNIKRLSASERKIEIAKMIGGDNFSDTALKSATELIGF
jgi:DNA repair protein RecN (Recombination protein N)